MAQYNDGSSLLAGVETGRRLAEGAIEQFRETRALVKDHYDKNAAREEGLKISEMEKQISAKEAADELEYQSVLTAVDKGDRPPLTKNEQAQWRARNLRRDINSFSARQSIYSQAAARNPGNPHVEKMVQGMLDGNVSKIEATVKMAQRYVEEEDVKMRADDLSIKQNADARQDRVADANIRQGDEQLDISRSAESRQGRATDAEIALGWGNLSVAKGRLANEGRQLDETERSNRAGEGFEDRRVNIGERGESRLGRESDAGIAERGERLGMDKDTHGVDMERARQLNATGRLEVYNKVREYVEVSRLAGVPDETIAEALPQGIAPQDIVDRFDGMKEEDETEIRELETVLARHEERGDAKRANRVRQRLEQLYRRRDYSLDSELNFKMWAEDHSLVEEMAAVAKDQMYNIRDVVGPVVQNFHPQGIARVAAGVAASATQAPPSPARREERPSAARRAAKEAVPDEPVKKRTWTETYGE